MSDKDIKPSLESYLVTGFYQTMQVFYALHCLQSQPLYPIQLLKICSTEKIIAKFETLLWTPRAWNAGSWTDEFLTLCYFQNLFFTDKIDMQPLFAWLNKKAKPHTGLWGGGMIPPHKGGYSQ